ncbi:MAG TPA: phosphoribosylformylglycinamidine synthase subunit PurQ, partial [Actinomycetales bacterium]|nr:phosphoribosylformylglycinamidine synthase subunit PurQ [Actinomycetales bacterium]
MRIGVITFPGTIDDRETAAAVTAAGAEPIELWHNEANLARVDAVVLPGGAAHGNYLRPGALAAHAPIMTRVASAAESGLPVFGINNGFQILCEAGLLPGALVANASARFECVDARLRFEDTATPFTSAFQAGEEIVLPVRTKAGAFVADAKTITRLESKNQIVAR